MKVFLTGATGLLGGHILHELINRNIAVKCLYRNSVPEHLKTYKQVEFVEGDITNKESLKNAIPDCTAIIHTAADTSMFPSHSEKRKRINIDGTKHLIDLTISNNIERFIYIGTANIFKYGTLENPGNELIKTSTTRGMPQYIKTKITAQKLVEKAIETQGLKAIITTPCFLLGENDFKPSSGKMIQTIIDKKLSVSSPGGKNILYAKDAAVAICNALHMGKIGETYILGNTNISYNELFNKIAHYASVPPPRFKIPCFAIKIFGFLGSSKEFLFKKTPLFNLPMAKASCQKNYFSAAKAIKELQLPTTPIDTIIQNTVSWFLHK